MKMHLFCVYSQTTETVTVPVVNLCFRVGSRTWHEVAFCFIFAQVFGLKIKTNSRKMISLSTNPPPFSPSPYLFFFYILSRTSGSFCCLLQKRICHRVSKDKKALVLASNVIFFAPKRHNLATPKAYRSRNKGEKSLEVAGTGKLGKPP